MRRPICGVIVAARPDCHLDIDDLVAYGQCVVVGPASLRFRLDETMELVRSRLGARVDNDTAARLHEVTEGWPLGAPTRAHDHLARRRCRADVAGMAMLDGELHDHFVKLLLANLDPGDSEFLVRISILDHLHPDLCRAVDRTMTTRSSGWRA